MSFNPQEIKIGGLCPLEQHRKGHVKTQGVGVGTQGLGPRVSEWKQDVSREGL